MADTYMHSKFLIYNNYKHWAQLDDEYEYKLVLLPDVQMENSYQTIYMTSYIDHMTSYRGHMTS